MDGIFSLPRFPGGSAGGSGGPFRRTDRPDLIGPPPVTIADARRLVEIVYREVDRVMRNRYAMDDFHFIVPGFTLSASAPNRESFLVESYRLRRIWQRRARQTLTGRVMRRWKKTLSETQNRIIFGGLWVMGDRVAGDIEGLATVSPDLEIR